MPAPRSLPPYAVSHLTLWLLLLGIAGGHAQDFNVGMSAPLGAEGGLLADGMRFAFWEANAAGGIASRNVSLLALDDGADIPTGVANIQRLANQSNVLLLAGVYGTVLTLSALPTIIDQDVPCVGAYTGAAELHSPFTEQVINVRASFADEMVTQANFLLNVLQVRRIACLYQNNSFGWSGLAALSNALASVGLQLAAAGHYPRGSTNVTAAVAAIAGAGSPPQAVVLVASIGASVNFITAFSADPRADPSCVFTTVSSVWSPSVTTLLDRRYWPRLYFGLAVPVPGDPSWRIATKFNTKYAAWGKVPEPIAFEGYINGRLVVEVLRTLNHPNVTRKMFLDAVYNTRLFVLDDLLVGMYSRNYPGCAAVLCACNSGIRDVFLAQLDGATGKLLPLGGSRYAITECANPVDNVVVPMLFGQLVPTWDAGWNRVALEMGRGMQQAFAEANAGGGFGGRSFALVQQNYSANATAAMQQLAARYPLLGAMASVVHSTTDIQFIQPTIPTVGTFDIAPDATTAGYVRRDMRVQPATALELMALAKFAVQTRMAIHLRAPATADGQAMLEVMIQSVHNFQQRPSSAELFSAASAVLSETQTGCVIALGSVADVAAWFTGLAAYPALHLLTLSGFAMQLMATVDVASTSQAPRLHFPTLMTGSWNTTTAGPEPSEPWKYGYLTAVAAVQAMRGSEYAAYSSTTPAEFIRAWYLCKVMSSGAVNLGPYYNGQCTPGATDCACNEGGNSLAVRDGASSAIEVLYSITTCQVVYLPFVEPSTGSTAAAIGGALGGCFGLCLVLLPLLYHRLTRRSHSAAPKDPSRPFCVLFTDIQSSTHLWATLPDLMAPALEAHHALIRHLIAKYKCYEVKTIGDSFMCAAHTPQQAVHLALAIQTELHRHPWGTDAIAALYAEDAPPGDAGQVDPTCWAGLRVRVGLHYGLGDVRFDPVTRGYDYYGTVANTAARIESVCHGGQVGVSQAVYDAVRGDLPDVVWADLGTHYLRGLMEPIRLFQALPTGPLAARTFPPLRLGRAARRPEPGADEEGEGAVALHELSPSGVKTNTGTSSSALPSSSSGDKDTWLESHPLVVRGTVAVEELKQFHDAVSATVTTLMNTQTPQFREQMVAGLCERLHVAPHGMEGPGLQRTLRGLVRRLLPPTVKAALALLPAIPYADSKGLAASEGSHPP